MKMYHLNPNTYDYECFVVSDTKENALESMIEGNKTQIMEIDGMINNAKRQVI